MSPVYIILSMVLWTAVSIWIAAAAKKDLGRGVSEYFLGGGRLKGFVSGMTYAATTYSAFMLVGLVGLTYRSGVGALGFELTYLAFTVVFLVVFGPRFWLAGRRYGHITPPELLSNRYGNKWVAVTSSAISLVMLIPYSAVQLMGAGFLVSGLTADRVPFMAGVLLMAGLSGFSALWAGMRSVAWTDTFQGVTMIITSVLALVFIMFKFFGSPVGFFDTVEAMKPELLKFTWTPELFIGLTLPWAFFALTNPQVSQRMYVPDRVESLKRMIIFFSVFGLLYTVISTLFGYQAAVLIPGLRNADQAMPSLLTKVPVAVSIIIFIGIYAAASSTLGSILLTLSSLFVRDIAANLSPSTDEKSQTLLGKISMAVIIAVCVVFAWFRPGLISVLSSMSSGGLLVMAPAIVGAFFWKRATAAGALVSMLVAACVTGFLYIAGPKFYPLGWWPSVWGLLLSTVLFVAVSAFTKAPANAGEFLGRLDRELEENNFRLRRR